ncbi:hypothetical protein ALT761_00925 [Alteromonas sp. 76-1]|nr:hypothetical protein ALT761_00925 [Alteromonas sp. 76-1]
MPSKTKLKHIFVFAFAFAFALLGIVPIFLMHALTNVFDTSLIKSDALRALLTISPMASCVAGITLAMLYIAKHPELL